MIEIDSNGNVMCSVIYILFILKLYVFFLAGPPGVCVDDNGNERKVSTVC